MSKNPLSPKTSRILAILGLAACGIAMNSTSFAASANDSAAGVTAAYSFGGIGAKIEALEAKIKGLQQPAEWVMKTGSGDVTSKTVYKLCNTQSGECLGWQKHKSGLNISWFGQAADKQARLVKKDGGPIKYGDTIALFVGQTSDSYLCYTKRTFGINLDWSTKPCYQWRIDAPAGGAKTGQTLRVDDPFVLFNLTENDTMVRCSRDLKDPLAGALKWGKTCSKNDLIVTNASLYAQLVKDLAALKSKL